MGAAVTLVVMFSERFQRPLHVTRHAGQRMLDRCISEALLFDLIETGTLRSKDAVHAWLFKGYPDRKDNMLCAAVLLDDAVIVKTVMHHFTPE